MKDQDEPKPEKIVLDLDFLKDELRKDDREELILKDETKGLYFGMTSRQIKGKDLVKLGLQSLEEIRKAQKKSKNGMSGVD